MATASLINWSTTKAIQLQAGDWQALLIPEHGGNLISLKNSKQNLDVVRTPPDLDTYLEKPAVWGIPLLFTPNRIADGRFNFNNIIYQFPVNEEICNNNLHGFMLYAGWEIDALVENDTSAEAILVFDTQSQPELTACFPHHACFKLTYRLEEEKLSQQLCITNKSSKPMPLGVGFHTAFNIPFAANSKADDYRLKLTAADKRWEMCKNRYLPTEKLVPFGKQEQPLLKEGLKPCAYPVSTHCPVACPGQTNQAIIENHSCGLRLVYKISPEYKHWMLWNNEAEGGFICPEPQTWMVNAPNVSLADPISGFQALEPQATWQANSEIYIESISTD